VVQPFKAARSKRELVRIVRKPAGFFVIFILLSFLWVDF
jgi:hypothetical protein